MFPEDSLAKIVSQYQGIVSYSLKTLIFQNIKTEISAAAKKKTPKKQNNGQQGNKEKMIQ